MSHSTDEVTSRCEEYRSLVECNHTWTQRDTAAYCVFVLSLFLAREMQCGVAAEVARSIQHVSVHSDESWNMDELEKVCRRALDRMHDRFSDADSEFLSEAKNTLSPEAVQTIQEMSAGLDL